MKAVLPVGGTGKKLMPLTATIPKPLLPIRSKAAINYILDEVIASGCDEIAFVTKYRSKDLEDYFRLNEFPEYDGVSMEFILQGDRWGMGDAVMCARDFVGDGRFCVVLGDDIVRNDVPALKQMVDAREHGNVMGCVRVPDEMTMRYGMFFTSDPEDSVFRADRVIEKPREYMGSNLAMTGRYVLEPCMFDRLAEVLERMPTASLTEAVGLAAERGDGVFGVLLKGKRYDIGSKEGYERTFVDAVLDDWQ